MKNYSLLTFAIMLMSLWLTAQTTCPNAVVNGDFESGNTGFTSGLPLGCSCTSGTYCVNTNFNLKCAGWPNLADHTPTGVGNYLIIDGNTSTATNVWSTTVASSPGATYTFSFWVASVYPTSQQVFDLAMMVNGQSVNQVTVSQATPNWVQYTFTGICPAGVTSMPIAIRQVTGGAFRDFGLDDIYFACCGCQAGFNITNIGNCGNYQFTNTSTSPLPIASYSWNFGDNTTSTLPNPTHQFATCGTYDVCLIIAGENCKDTICQTVTVSDITPPVARCKPGVGVILNANCQYNVTSAFVDNGSTDNCQIKSLVVNPAILFGCGNTTVTLTVTDWCNNRSTCTIGIQTIETVPPVITCPPTATVTCTKDTIPSVTGIATATDNCPGVITFTHSDIVTGNFPCDATIRRTWTATDACGNSSSCVQTIIVRDNVPPVAICKPGVGVILDANCMYTVTPAFVDGGSTDNCQIQSMSVSPNKITGCGLTTVTFTVTDLCNNKSTCTMGIQTIETVPPVITCPPTATVTCTKDTIPSVTGIATATDNCPGVITFTHSDVVSGNMPCDATIRRTWTATDACGNSSSCVQTIIVRDNVPPTIVCPQSYSVNTNAGVCYFTGALTPTTATDNCDPNPTITCSLITPTSSILITPQTQFPKGINNISCIARDNCGNTSTACTFTLTVVDNEKPTITCPLSISVLGTLTPPPTQCKAIVNGLAPTITDNCPMWTVGYVITGATSVANGGSDASGTMFMQGISTVTYTVTDMGGNKATCSFNVDVKCDTCKCGSFADMNFRPAQGAPTSIVKCGDTLNVGCSPNFNPIIGGSFSCVGNNCSPNTIQWELRQLPSGPVIASGNIIASPSFSLSLLSSYFFTAGMYELTLTGQCGTQTCPPCKFKINSSGCPCECGAFTDMTFRPAQGAQTASVRCGDTLTVSCNPNFNPIIGGNFSCLGVSCPTVVPVTWQLRQLPNGPVIASGNLSGPAFSLALLASYFTTAGMYELTFTGQCGNQTCTPCKFIIKATGCPCECGTFTDMTFRPSQGAPNAPVRCGDTLTISCSPNFNPIIGGNFSCLGVSCPTVVPITWQLRKLPSGPVIANGNLSGPIFSLALLASYFNTAGLYELTFTGQCGNVVCTPCKFIIKVLPNVNLNLNLTGYFPFNGNSNDVSPTLINGTGTNLTTTSSLNSPTSAYSFNGTSSWIDCTNSNRGVIDMVSVCAWVKTTETAKGMWVAGQYNGPSQARGYSLSIGDVNNSAGSIGLASFGGRVDIGAYYSATSTTKINDGKWHCIVGTAGNGEWKIYVDGNLEGSQIPIGMTTPSIAPTATPFTIGRVSDLAVSSNLMWYNGSMDDVRVYNRVLNKCEIDSLCSIRIVSGVKDAADKIRILITPNPTQGTFTVELPQPATSKMSFRITDLAGRLVMEKQTEVGHIIQNVEASKLADGLYFLQVVTEGRIIAVEKFVKQ